jgi:hypothetical protein
MTHGGTPRIGGVDWAGGNPSSLPGVRRGDKKRESAPNGPSARGAQAPRLAKLAVNNPYGSAGRLQSVYADSIERAVTGIAHSKG